jgi:hypothetical protein
VAKCAYCHQQKGKRSCPALSGVICSRCCGEHRLQRISCPLDCVYLGGSAALKLSTEATDESLGRLTELATPRGFELAAPKVVEYALSAGRRDIARDAFKRFFRDEEQPDLTFEPAFIGWLVHGHVPPGHDGTALEQFLAERGTRLTREETASLLALKRGHFTIFEVLAGDAGAVSYRVRDVFDGQEVEVHEPAETPSFDLTQPERLACGWVFALSNGHWLAGPPIRLPERLKEFIGPAVAEDLEGWRKDAPGLDDRALRSRHVDAIFGYVLELMPRRTAAEDATGAPAPAP